MKEFRSFPKGEKKPRLTKQDMWRQIKIRAVAKQKAKQAPLQDADDKFLRGLWNQIQIHKCENCSAPLGNKYKKWFADHILEKSKYPELRYEEFDIWWLCLICHRNKTDMNLSQIMVDKINQTIKYYEQLKGRTES